MNPPLASQLSHALDEAIESTHVRESPSDEYWVSIPWQVWRCLVSAARDAISDLGGDA